MNNSSHLSTTPASPSPARNTLLPAGDLPEILEAQRLPEVKDRVLARYRGVIDAHLAFDRAAHGEAPDRGEGHGGVTAVPEDQEPSEPRALLADVGGGHEVLGAVVRRSHPVRRD